MLRRHVYICSVIDLERVHVKASMRRMTSEWGVDTSGKRHTNRGSTRSIVSLRSWLTDVTTPTGSQDGPTFLIANPRPTVNCTWVVTECEVRLFQASATDAMWEAAEQDLDADSEEDSDGASESRGSSDDGEGADHML